MLWLLLAILILGGAAYVVRDWTHEPPSITITSPTEDEAWRPGEDHVISWETSNLPATDKIAITIRRIPPPPLQEEGQEFDPVIATDLPNTGSAVWKISSMYPDGTYVIGLTSYASTPVSDPVMAESAPFTITHPALLSDIYPLYPQAIWHASETESFRIGTTSYSGASITSEPLDASMDPGSILTPFENYYDTRLKSQGWEVANDLAAGGHVGGQTGYRKGNSVILTRFRIDYETRPQDAPSECPCTVTLSVFSSTR